MPSTIGSFVVNQYTSSNGVGHVDITLYDGPNGKGTDLGTFGLNIVGSPNGGGATGGGWYSEDDLLASAITAGTVHRSTPENVSMTLINAEVQFLTAEVGSRGQLGSPGYFLYGDNCVDGVALVLSQLQAIYNVVQYMTPNLSLVYLYAAQTESGIAIPTPDGGVLLTTNPYHVVVQLFARTEELVQDHIVPWAFSLVGSNGQVTGTPSAPDGRPDDPNAYQITLTIDSSNHTASITAADPTTAYVYDSQGNLIGTTTEYGLPSSINDALVGDLNDMISFFSLDE